MIALLSYSTNLFASDNLVTGELVTSNDSIMIAYDDLRIVNSKLIELDYEKEINTHLKQVIENDITIIKNYTELNTKLNKDYKRAITQRNICFGIAVGLTILSSIVLIAK